MDDIYKLTWNGKKYHCSKCGHTRFTCESSFGAIGAKFKCCQCEKDEIFAGRSAFVYLRWEEVIPPENNKTEEKEKTNTTVTTQTSISGEIFNLVCLVIQLIILLGILIALIIWMFGINSSR
jgi:hypothetical protein